MTETVKKRPWWRMTLFVFIMLVIEFLDEFVFSAGEAALPLIRDSFDLSYTQIGLFLTIPALLASFIEPVIGIFADTKHRKTIMVGGGLVFGAGLIFQGISPTFAILVLAVIVQYPASGAFVTVAQASLMDNAPHRRENNMALWTFSGSLAVVAGPLVLTGMLALGGGWREFFIGGGILTIIAALWVMRLPANGAFRNDEGNNPRTIRDNIRGAITLLRSRSVWRWLILLQFSDIMLDILFSLLALYMVDVVGVSITQAGIAIAVWTSVGLLGDFLLIPLLERVSGLSYLRVSVVMELILYPSFLLVDGWLPKLVLLGLIGLFNAGWYAILQGKLYDELGEQSGAVLIVGNIAGIGGAFIPAILGWVAQNYGLETSMWLLVVSPLALFLGLPKNSPEKPT